MKQTTFLLAVATALFCSSSVESFGVTPSSSAPSHAGIDTARQYASSVAPISSPPATSDLAERMRKMVEYQKAKTLKEEKEKAAQTSSKIQEVLTLEDFKTAIAEEKEQITIVRFYAHWCRGCKAVTPAYLKFVAENGDKIKFVDAPKAAVNVDVHKAMGVKILPLVHVYHPEAGLIEERRMSRKHYSNFEKVAKSYVDGSCEIKDDECSDPYPNITVEAETKYKKPAPILTK